MSAKVRGRRALALSLSLLAGATAGALPADVQAAPAYNYGDDGTTDPRKAELPRKHRFRLAIEGGHIRLSAAADPDTGESQRFHWAPLLIDAAYQLQFLKYMMIRPGIAVGPNVANSRFAMPLVISPRFFAGYQGRRLGLAAGYSYYFVGYPGLTVENGGDGRPDSLGGPRIWHNHGILGELSFTSRIDGVAIVFATRLGAVKSKIQHYGLSSDLNPALNKFRLHWGVQLGFYFDGTLRRRRKARAAERNEP